MRLHARQLADELARREELTAGRVLCGCGAGYWLRPGGAACPGCGGRAPEGAAQTSAGAQERRSCPGPGGECGGLVVGLDGLCARRDCDRQRHAAEGDTCRACGRLWWQASRTGEAERRAYLADGLCAGCRPDVRAFPFPVPIPAAAGPERRLEWPAERVDAAALCVARLSAAADDAAELARGLGSDAAGFAALRDVGEVDAFEMWIDGRGPCPSCGGRGEHDMTPEMGPGAFPAVCGECNGERWQGVPRYGSTEADQAYRAARLAVRCAVEAERLRALADAVAACPPSEGFCVVCGERPASEQGRCSSCWFQRGR